MKRFLFTIVQIIWGAPQTLLGALMYLATAGRPHFSYHGAFVRVWKSANSVSLGLFMFVSENPLKQGLVVSAERSHAKQNEVVFVDQRLVAHEYGHCMQSLILGPLYLIVIGIPSFIWAMLPGLRKRRARTSTSYYSFYTERFANFLVEKFMGESPIK